MTIKLGVVMDPIGTINPKKDSTLAMLLAAQQRGWALSYMELGDLSLRDGKASAWMRELSVQDDLSDWYRFGAQQSAALGRAGCDPDAQGPAGGQRVHLRHPDPGTGRGRRACWWPTSRRACATPMKNSTPPGSRTARRRPWSRAAPRRSATFSTNTRTSSSNPCTAWAATPYFACTAATTTSTW